VPLGLACAALAVLCLMAARSQQRLASFSAAPAAVGSLQAAEQRAALAARVDAELVALRQIAAHARAAATSQS